MLVKLRLIAQWLFTLSSLSLAQDNEATKAFEVVSIKRAAPLTTSFKSQASDPQLLRLRYVSLKYLFIKAWQVNAYQIKGPKWLDTDCYDVVAKVPESAYDQKLIPRMLRTLLEERFQVRAHEESRTLPVYHLISTNGGSKLKKTDAISPATDATAAALAKARKMGKSIRGLEFGGNLFRAGDVTLIELAGYLSGIVGRPVIDRTGIKGSYDFTLSVSPSDVAGGWNDFYPDSGSSSQAESIFSSIRQYGLKFEKGLSPISIIIIDNIEREPSVN